MHPNETKYFCLKIVIWWFKWYKTIICMWYKTCKAAFVGIRPYISLMLIHFMDYVQTCYVIYFCFYCYGRRKMSQISYLKKAVKTVNKVFCRQFWQFFLIINAKVFIAYYSNQMVAIIPDKLFACLHWYFCPFSFSFNSFSLRVFLPSPWPLAPSTDCQWDLSQDSGWATAKQ